MNREAKSKPRPDQSGFSFPCPPRATASIFMINEMRIDKRKEHDREYYLKNKEKRKEYRQKNKDKRIEYIKKYIEENYDKYIESQKRYKKKRLQSDPLFKLTDNIRVLVFNSFTVKNRRKKSKTTDILGCTFEEFKQHIESQFEPWMNWNNRGGRDVMGPNMTWDIDHIIPVSSAITEEELIKLNHYTNFQPLCSYQNRFIKKNKI